MEPPRLVTILTEIGAIRDALDRMEHQVIGLVRDGGESWESIGEDLGISRQAARNRFSKPKRRRSSS